MERLKVVWANVQIRLYSKLKISCKHRSVAHKMVSLPRLSTVLQSLCHWLSACVGRVVSQNLSRAEAYYKFAAEIAQRRRLALPSILVSVLSRAFANLELVKVVKAFILTLTCSIPGSYEH